MTATNVLIIEDQLLTAMDLETIVTSLGHTVQDVATTKTVVNPKPDWK